MSQPMNENNPHTHEEYDTIESLELEEDDYFPLGKINCARYGEKATEDEWDVVYRTAPTYEENSTHILRDPEGQYVLFDTNVDGFHRIKQIGAEIEAEPVTPDNEEVSDEVEDVFHEHVLGNRNNFDNCEFCGDILHATLRLKDGWPQAELDLLDEASKRDVSYEVELVCEDSDDK